MSTKTFTINLEWMLFWTLLFVGLTALLSFSIQATLLIQAGGADFYLNGITEFGRNLYWWGVTSISAVAVFICLCLLQIVRYLARIAKILEDSSGIP